MHVPGTEVRPKSRTRGAASSSRSALVAGPRSLPFDEQEPEAPPTPEPTRRLVVELSRKSAGELSWLVDVEELNKTTLVNRALHVFALLIEAREQGRKVLIEDPNKAGDFRELLIV